MLRTMSGGRRMVVSVGVAAALAAALALFQTPAPGVETTWLYGWFTAFLLAVGLYCATYSIDLAAMRKDWRLILAAVTIGVLLKAAIIGGVMVWLFGDPIYWLVGIAVAQIDPLSVAALEQDAKMSSRAKTILRAWSSLDDPMTALLVVYLPLLLSWLAGSAIVPQLVDAPSLAGVGRDFYHNLAFAALGYGFWRLSEHLGWRWMRYSVLAVLFVTVLLATSAFWFWMLAAAVLGLVMRPPLGRVVDEAPKVAFLAATVLLFMLMYRGVQLVPALALGVAAYGSQVVVGHLVTLGHGLSWHDRWRLALGQQNGITAMMLALVLETVHSGSVAVIAPAIFFVAVLYVTANKLAGRWLPDA